MEPKSAKAPDDQLKISEESNPFCFPTNEEVFNFQSRSQRSLWKEYKSCGEDDPTFGSLRETRPPQKRGTDPIIDHSSRTKTVLPCSARDYLWSVEESAKDKLITSLMHQETHRLEINMKTQQEDVLNYEQQLHLHEVALEQFLYDHYAQVSSAVKKNDETHRLMKDQEERMDYYSGLLKAAQTVQEEERERLQELTAFQHFLAAVTPQQSLKDLLRCLKPKDKTSLLKQESITEHSNQKKRQTKSSNEPVTSISYLQAEVASLRMLNIVPEQTVAGEVVPKKDLQLNTEEKPEDTSEEGHKSSMPKLKEETASGIQEEEEVFDAHLFDPYLDDPSHLLQLSHLYENQCHALLSLLTRVKQHQDALKSEIKNRQEKLQHRLSDLDRLQSSSDVPQKKLTKEHSPEEATQLSETEDLIKNWSQLAGDEEAKLQLAILGKQIGEVVSDAFGSSEFIPLSMPQIGDSEDKNETQESVSLGHGALLTLLEARVTDLCSQLDFLESSLRDPIFKRCEHERKTLAEDLCRREEERLRVIRRQQHYQRAIASPPPRP